MKYFHIGQQIKRKLKVSGHVIDNVHFLTLGFLTLWHRAIAIHLSPSAIAGMSLKKEERTDGRIREVEHGSFSPLVFSTAGGMGTTANVVYKRIIASLIADKHGKPYMQ